MKNIELYKQHHKENEIYGNGGALKFHLRLLADVILETKSKTLLDYGSGKGSIYYDRSIQKHWGGIMPSLYDPAVPEFEKLPDGPFDGVYSIDVMEHIPHEEVPEVLEQIFDRAERFVFLGIATDVSKTILPNGENAHCTVESTDWWEKQILGLNGLGIYTQLHTYGKGNDYRIYNDEHFLNNI